MTELADVVRAQAAGVSAEAERAGLLMRRAAVRLQALEAYARRCADLAREATDTALPLTHRQMAASVLAQIAKETP